MYGMSPVRCLPSESDHARQMQIISVLRPLTPHTSLTLHTHTTPDHAANLQGSRIHAAIRSRRLRGRGPVQEERRAQLFTPDPDLDIPPSIDLLFSARKQESRSSGRSRSTSSRLPQNSSTRRHAPHKQFEQRGQLASARRLQGSIDFCSRPRSPEPWRRPRGSEF